MSLKKSLKLMPDFNDAIKETILNHTGSKSNLADSIIGMITIESANNKKRYDQKIRSKSDEKLKKKAGCCFSMFCCCCANEGSVICRFIGLFLLFGFIVRVVQGVILFF